MLVGNIIAFTGQTIPEGYMNCDGSAVSRVEYSELFNTIGTTYGDGDGSTTFNLPNLSGRVAVGVSQNYVEGSVGGEETHLITSLETASHTHVIPEHTHGNTIEVTMPALSHTITQEARFKLNQVSSTTNRITHAGNVDICISRAQEAPTVNPSLSVAAHQAKSCTVTGGITDCPAFNTETTGSGQPHNNMMPYMAITYLIRVEPLPPSEQCMAVYNGHYITTAGGGYIANVRG